jgi:hypothetical protein
MDLLTKVSGVAASPHAGRALTAAKVLNFVGTVRGAVTTVLVVASAAGGAATVTNVVQQDLLPAIERSTVPPAAPAAPAPTPVTAAAIRAKAESSLKLTLSTDLKAAEELRKIAVLSGASLDQLVADTKQLLQRRYDQGMALIGTLLQPTDAEGAEEPAASSIVVVNALVSVVADDLNRIIVGATQAARGRISDVARPPSAAQGVASPVQSQRAEVEGKLTGTLAADLRSVDDLAAIATIDASRLAQLILDTKGKLQARYDQGLAVLDALAVDPNAPPSASALSSLVQVITNDLNAITRQARQLAMYQPTPAPTTAFVPDSAPRFVPQVAVPVAPTRTPTPTPRTASPAPRTPSPAPRTASPAPRTNTPPPSTATPAPRTPTPPPATARPTATP